MRDQLKAKAAAIVEKYQDAKQYISLAESCTGGLLAVALTEVSGSGHVLERSLVTYTNVAKQELLGVTAHCLDNCGAVSAECAGMMAKGVLIRSHADVALSITGIAGPTGGTPDKPVGTVFMAIMKRGDVKPQVHHHLFGGDREAIRWLTVDNAMNLLLGMAF